MTDTGIIRRIDELGRVVIPKGIRRSLKIKDGDPLQIWIDGGRLVLIKDMPADDMQDAINTLQRWLKDVKLSASMTDIERMTLKILLDKITATNS